MYRIKEVLGDLLNIPRKASHLIIELRDDQTGKHVVDAMVVLDWQGRDDYKTFALAERVRDCLNGMDKAKIVNPLELLGVIGRLHVLSLSCKRLCASAVEDGQPNLYAELDTMKSMIDTSLKSLTERT